MPAMKISPHRLRRRRPRFPGTAPTSCASCSASPPAPPKPLTVAVIEANIDDLNPQVLATPSSACSKPARSTSPSQPVLMKKSRPGTLLRVIARPEDREALAADRLRRNLHAGPAHLHRRAPRAGPRFVEVETPHGNGPHQGLRRRRLRARVRRLPQAGARHRRRRSSRSSPKPISPT